MSTRLVKNLLLVEEFARERPTSWQNWSVFPENSLMYEDKRGEINTIEWGFAQQIEYVLSTDDPTLHVLLSNPSNEREFLTNPAIGTSNVSRGDAEGLQSQKSDQP